jgi:hypothetical protein
VSVCETSIESLNCAGGTRAGVQYAGELRPGESVTPRFNVIDK